jgi:hypothetical protein
MARSYVFWRRRFNRARQDSPAFKTLADSIDIAGPLNAEDENLAKTRNI